MSVKYMDVKEFLDSGLLFQVNKEVLHPLGLALEVTVEDDGTARLSGIWDCRDDLEGIEYESSTFEHGMAKYRKYMTDQGNDAIARREMALGFVVQQPGDDVDN